MEINRFKEKYIALDLEMNQPSGTIIQIGGAFGSYKENEPIETFSAIINPLEILEPRIIELTGITQDNVDNGVTLIEGYNQLLNFLKDKELFINPITWGGGDSIELKEQLLKLNVLDVNNWKFGRRWIDTKTLYCGYRIANGKEPAGGLAKAMTHMGLKFEGRKHNAMDDAKNTLIMFRKMIQFFKL